MATALLALVVVLVLVGLVFGVVWLLSGDDPGLVPVDPDGRARPLPNDRSLHEEDLAEVRFDVVVRGYRMGQVDRVLRRTAYDLGFKDEMIAVLEAEVAALRDGRREDADVLRRARESATSPEPASKPVAPEPAAEPVSDATVAEEAAGEESTAGPADETDEESRDTEPEAREGSLRRRRPAPEKVSASLVAGAETDLDGPALEVADRPAHA